MSRPATLALRAPALCRLARSGVLPLALCGCGTEDGGETATLTETSAGTTDTTDTTETTESGTTDGSGTGGDTGEADTGATECEPVPSERVALEAWLAAESYAMFAGESGPHDSDGPHFGTVRTFVNGCMAASLDAGNTEHPPGAAAVKELYASGSSVQGYSVMVKVGAGSSEGWYWYEGFNGTVYGDGIDDDTCIGCHSSGQGGFRSPWPLQ